MDIEREYRKRRRMPRTYVLLMGFLALNGVFQGTRDNSSVALWARAGLIGLIVVGYARLLVYMWRGRTLVTADGVTARRAVTERRRTWHDIYDIRVEAVPRAPRYERRYLTRLYDTDGRRFVLPHLDDWQFDEPWTEVAELREAAARHRGATWERQPAVEALIRRRAGHRKAWERSALGGAVAFLCGCVAWVWLVITTDGPPTLPLFLYLPLAVFALLAALLNWRWESQVPKELREPQP